MNKKWYNESVFYHIYPLGFCDAPKENDYNLEPVERLYKICEWIPHMKEMGINALYLGPLFESQTHGYDTVDYYKVDRRLGTNETLKNVVKDLHNNGIKVVLDGVFNHVSRDFWAFKDLMKNQGDSLHKEWFSGVNFEHNSPLGDNFTYDCWSGHYILPKLNLSNEYVESHILNAITMWVQEFDIDGIRLDVADVLDFDFMKELSTFCKTIKVDFWLMGEVIHGDYRKWVNPEMLDSTTNYECYKGMFSSFNDKNFFEIAHSLKRLFDKTSGIYKGFDLYNFVDNHDVNRIGSTLTHTAHIYPLHILMFTIPGIPSIYYGSEWGIEGVKDGVCDSVIRPSLNLESMYSESVSDIKDAISRISHIWHNSKCLKNGSYTELLTTSEQFVFLREFNGEKVVVALNLADEAINVKIPYGESNYKLIDLLNNNEVFTVKDNGIILEIPGCWGRILSCSTI